MALRGKEWHAGGQYRLYEELHNLYISPIIIYGDQTRRVRWAVHVAHSREMRDS